MSDAPDILSAAIVLGDAETSALAMGLMFQMAADNIVLIATRAALELEAGIALAAADRARQQRHYDFLVSLADQREAERGEG
jgi:hypothetical protein